jgi:hypothetical protein
MSIKIFGAALTAIVLLIGHESWSQTYAESALQFSRSTPTGSARVQGIGGSQIALGGDYSSALSNPAGLGMYNKSEITIGTNLSFLRTNASYLGNNDEEVKPSLNIPGFSVVLHLPKEGSTSYIGSTIGISYTRTNDFNQSTFYHGTNDNTSIIDSFLDIADSYYNDGYDNPDQIFGEGGPEYNTPTGLAYYNFLIGPEDLLDPPGNSYDYFTDVASIPRQQEDIQTKGSSSQWSFSYGGNYKDKLFFGAGVGVTSLHYKSSKVYTESFSDDLYLNNLSLEENLNISGNGINATIGVTGRPLNFLQIGAAFTTPTLYSLSEKYDAYMSTSWKDFDYYGDGSEILNNEDALTDVVTSSYTLTTPAKLSAGIALISKFGFITGDVDFTNQATARYSSEDDGLSLSSDNSEIKSTYKSALNYRVGAEYRYEIFRVRAGFGVQGNNYKNEFDVDNTITTISGGAGVRLKHWFIDFALVNSRGKNLYSPYYGAPIVDIKNSLTKGIVTAGFTF